MANPHTNADPVPFIVALRFWLKLGFISFGGPAGQIAIMHDELVVRRKWIDEPRFLHALNYCMLLPGPEAQQLATYIGWLMHGARGGIAAGVLFVAPSLLILIGLSWVYMAFGNAPTVTGVLYGIKPVVVAIVGFAAYRIGARVLKTAPTIVIAVLALLSVALLNVPFPLIVAVAAAIGFIGNRLAPRVFSAETASINATQSHKPFRASHAIRNTALAIALWMLVEAALAWTFGWQSVLAQLGWFFTKAALVTFGGAYAVLPYVFQGSVEHYRWLTTAQMMDGLALGETTPGPLIMIVAFIGFIAAWSQAALGTDSLLLAGIAGACVATFFTFLPSFVFILVGAPLIEATRAQPRLTAPLAAITAAVVGVIAHFGLFLAKHVMWPGALDATAVAIGAIAFVALWRFKVSVVVVVSVGAIVGWLMTLW